MAEWEWDAESRRYRDKGTGKYLSASKSIELRDDFAARQRAATDELARRLADGDVTVQRWVREMRERVRLAQTTEYAFGRGGRNAMTAQDREDLASLVRDQWGFLQGFGEDVRAGQLSAEQIAARAQLYMSQSTHAYERGRASAWGLELPAYPCDGRTRCLANCRCWWALEETADEIRATWMVSAGESCADCQDRAARYRPFVIAKEQEAVSA